MNLNRKRLGISLGVGSAMVLSLVGVPAAHASTTTTLGYAGGWATNGIANPVNTAGNNTVDTGLAYAPLAHYKYTTDSGYYPALAKSWSFNTKANTLTVHLNPNAKWSNGSPVTANDVYVTFELQFLDMNAESWTLTGMKILNPTTIVFQKDPHELYNTTMFERQILNNNWIVAAANYQQYIPKNIWTLVKQANGNPNASSTKKAQSALTAAYTKATGYNFPLNQLLYDGPWTLSRVTSAQELYVKNPYYVFAKNVTADQVLDINQTTNDVIWRALENGQVAYAGVGYSPTVYKAVMSVHDNHYINIPQSTGMALFFNENTAPFNNVKVRQALAYLIDRNSLTKIAEPEDGFVPKYEDGLIEMDNSRYLTPAQLKTLNTYSLNQSKAASLLKSAGFKKTGSSWVMPNGKPFKFNVYAPNYTDWDQGVDALVSDLQKFGIQATASVIDATTYAQEESEGKYPVYVNWWGGWDLAPSQSYNQLYITDNNY
ncbi:ABC transporter substrate-binding protein, partial [Alicyclobacillus acidiphilus]